MDTAGQAARKSALYLLDKVLGESRLMSELLAAGALDRLTPPDRARAQRLALSVLRNLDRADRLISRHVQKAPPLPVRNILRLGTLELAEGAAAHGVVNDLVAIASKSRRHGRLKGLVNAVLRKLATDAPRDWSGLATPRLPGWLRGPLTEAWGKHAIARMEQAHASGAPLDITAASDPERVAQELGGDLLPTGSIRLQQASQVTALPGYDAGGWWVQDAAAALPAKLIQGQRVIDLCAAPGGKTLQLSAMGADVTAVDVSEARLDRVKANLDRTGLRAQILVADARAVTGTWDAVLLDAPCSATGTIRRHPDLPHAKDGADIGSLITLQAELIDHAVTLLGPGGQLVFCTCSLLPDEGEVQVEEALARHPNLVIDRDALAHGWIESAWRSSEGGLRVRPDFWSDWGGMDGFYIAALRKT